MKLEKNNKYSKKLTAGLSAILISASLLSGCANNTVESVEPTEIVEVTPEPIIEEEISFEQKLDELGVQDPNPSEERTCGSAFLVTYEVNGEKKAVIVSIIRDNINGSRKIVYFFDNEIELFSREYIESIDEKAIFLPDDGMEYYKPSNDSENVINIISIDSVKTLPTYIMIAYNPDEEMPVRNANIAELDKYISKIGISVKQDNFYNKHDEYLNILYKQNGGNPSTGIESIKIEELVNYYYDIIYEENRVTLDELIYTFENANDKALVKSN